MIVMMGVAGSGKSIQSQMLSDQFGWKWLSTGEILRAHITDERREQMLLGKLLNDQEMIAVLDKVLSEYRGKEVILDGFPRTVPQAEWLLGKVESGVVRLDGVIHMQANEDVVCARLLARGRPDDTKEAIAERFREYREVTLPIIDNFEAAGIPIYDIDGEQSVEAVHQQILRVIEPVKN